MTVFHKPCLAALAMASALVLTGCGEAESDVAETATTEAPAESADYSIAAVKAASWPGKEAADTDLMDPVPTRENIMVVLDMSGSMGGSGCAGNFRTKSEAAKSVLRDWVQSVDKEANLGLIVFDASGTSVRLPLGRDNRDAFVDLISDAFPSGGTPLAEAVSLASNSLSEQAVYQQGYGRYRMTVITDGQHDPGQDPQAPLDRIFANAANPIEINTIGFCIRDSALNQPGLTQYQSARNPEELRAGLNQVLAESTDFKPIQEFNSDE
ncbi:vWA domain-containing protein [Marinobacter sp. JSM 1782161]|uniref:vWA domain-containing protein n=1 Tax=Marinobacter sp. JSM 1782161 TaxID=2685906 RepID=UPI0014033750|nr:vWA domain-containing protein [Marinobacter sp. JSM 1782161]